MRAIIRLAAAVPLALAATGCGPSVHVRTIVAPDTRLSAMHTFSMLPAAEPRNNRNRRQGDNPMISNSIAHRSIRAQIVRSLEERGYVLDETHPDFAVAFYASSYERLDLTDWDYGYPFYPPWSRRGRRAQVVTEYTVGTVIVDAISPRTRELMWRGEGRAALSDDPGVVVRELADAAAAIMRKFPRAAERVVAARR
jgi:hypothetical protein